jgi:hypothetical protein
MGSQYPWIPNSERMQNAKWPLRHRLGRSLFCDDSYADLLSTDYVLVDVRRLFIKFRHVSMWGEFENGTRTKLTKLNQNGPKTHGSGP